MIHHFHHLVCIISAFNFHAPLSVHQLRAHSAGTRFCHSVSKWGCSFPYADFSSGICFMHHWLHRGRWICYRFCAFCAVLPALLIRSPVLISSVLAPSTSVLGVVGPVCQLSVPCVSSASRVPAQRLKCGCHGRLYAQARRYPLSSAFRKP